MHSRSLKYKLVPLALLLQFLQFTVSLPRRTATETVPPLIVNEGPQALFYYEEEGFDLPCVATGEGQPTYKWQLNGKDFDPSGTDGRIEQQPGVGSLTFIYPYERDEGFYQCFSENGKGTALTVKTHLQYAYLLPFPAMSTRVYYPLLGAPLVLACNPPRSVPEANIIWATYDEDGRMIPLPLSDRVTVDPKGNLHFVNIVAEDFNEGISYTCLAENSFIRRIVNGAYAKISPRGVLPERNPAQIMWQSPTHQMALRGSTWRIKCIFSGNPTPTVEWFRKDKEMPPRYHTESFGQELVIEDIHYIDAGTYECKGTNDETLTPVKRSFELSIESTPTWMRRPESVEVVEGDCAVFHCSAHSIPETVVIWFVNGIPLSAMPSDSRRILEGNRLVFNNVTVDDSQVIQCNATNKHGYVFENAYLNVLSKPKPDDYSWFPVARKLFKPQRFHKQGEHDGNPFQFGERDMD